MPTAKTTDKIFRKIRGIMLFSLAVGGAKMLSFFPSIFARALASARAVGRGAFCIFFKSKNERHASEKHLPLDKDAMYHPDDLVTKYKVVDELIELGLL